LKSQLISNDLIESENIERIMKKSMSFSDVKKCKLVLSHKDQEGLMTKRLVKEMKRNELLYWFARLLSLRETLEDGLDKKSKKILQLCRNHLIDNDNNRKDEAMMILSRIPSQQIRNLLLDNNVSQSVVVKRMLCSHNMRILGKSSLKDEADLRAVENSKFDSDLRESTDEIYFSQQKLTLFNVNGEEY
jgi:hypothetical protein